MLLGKEKRWRHLNRKEGDFKYIIGFFRHIRRLWRTSLHRPGYIVLSFQPLRPRLHNPEADTPTHLLARKIHKLLLVLSIIPLPLRLLLQHLPSLSLPLLQDNPVLSAPDLALKTSINPVLALRVCRSAWGLGRFGFGWQRRGGSNAFPRLSGS